MEEEVKYTNDFLEETKNMIQKVLDDRGCGLVVAGEFDGDKIKTFVKIQLLKKNEIASDN